MRYKLTLAYDGTLFHGWQKQAPPGKDPLRTVQGVVEQAIREVARQPVNLLGASRTDSGVHARGQVAQFDADLPIPIERLHLAINSRLPEDVEVLSAEGVADTFDCIRDVTTKRYRYRLFNTSRRPLWRRHLVYHCWTPLDVARMSEAAGRLVGRHDVAGFAAAGHGRQDTVRNVHHCAVERHEEVDGDGPEVHVVIEGDGFIYNQVRIVAGTLVEVGRGRFEPDVIDRILATGDRALAGPTLPPQGLCLEWIRY